jgi:uncharacterized Zn-binding protein involved in type VI secretion
MAQRSTIRVGDKTSHGGTVAQGHPFLAIDGKLAAGIGHAVTCPQCEGAHYIVGGVDSFSIGGIPVAVEGMKTSCGATLIASQSSHSLEYTGGPVGQAAASFASGTLPPLMASDDDLEQCFVVRHGETGEPVQGMTYQLTSSGTSLIEDQQLLDGMTRSYSLTDHPDIQFVVWQTQSLT